MKARYVNPYTDFGFKKLFGEEANKDLLKDFLNELLPADFTREQLTQYEKSLKAYRDLKGVVDTSYEEGKTEGRVEEKMEIALKMMKMGEPLEKISGYTGLSIKEINQLKPT